MIEAVCFDIGGTLLEMPDSGFCTRLAKSLGYSVDDLRPYFEKHFLTAKRSFEEAITSFFDDTGIIDYSFRHKMNLPPSSYESRVYDDVIPTLRQLSSYRLSILSNSTPWETVNLEEIGIASYIDAVVYSFDIGVAKPDVRAYRAVENTLRINPQSIAMVGDSRVDIDGARRAGWWAVNIKRNHNRTDMYVEADIIIDKLTDLPSVLESL